MDSPQLAEAQPALPTKPYAKLRLAIVAAMALIIAGAIYWALNNRYITTDDAYVNAHVIHIASQVSGQVEQLPINNNDYLKKGSPLLTLDLRPFTLRIHQAEAELNMRKSDAIDAKLTQKRIADLTKEKAVAPQALDDVNARLDSTLAAVALAEAKLQESKLNYSYAQLIAPEDGWVTNFSLRPGDAVSANNSLFAFVVDNRYWIDANYLETQLHHIKPGQTATIKVDMYPGIIFHGVVDSISHGAGNAFSLLPPQNATGNWVKITQRVPVRVHVIDPDPKHPLRVGTSTTVTIDTDSEAESTTLANTTRG